MRTLFALLSIVICFSSLAQVDTVEVDNNSSTSTTLSTRFANANKAYTSENYDLAIAAYKQILEGDKHSAELYFNLGNAYYKKNEVGESIYYLEKALQLDPDDEDIQNNLRFANQMKIDAIEPLPENAIGSTVENIVTALSIDEWAYLSIVVVLITILLAIFYIYAATSGKKRLFFVLMILGILLSILTIMAAFYARDHVDDQQFAIVMVEEITGREAPKQSATSAFTIHEGTKIELLETFENWSRVSLENGSKAWLPEDVYRKL